MQCKSDCADTVHDLNACSSATCLSQHTSSAVERSGLCSLVKVGGGSASSTTSGQSTMDGKHPSSIRAPVYLTFVFPLAFVSGCKAAGININSPSGGDGSDSNPSSNPQSDNSISNTNTNAALVLTADGSVLAVALIGAVAYLF